jgi:hypothetical protein
MHRLREQRRRLRRVALAGLVSALAAATVPTASGHGAGTLAAHAELKVTSSPTSCPAGLPSDLLCADRKGSGVARGLGQVSESDRYFVDQEAPECGGAKRVPRTMVRLTVVGKGELDLVLDDSPDCFPGEALSLTRTFRVAGGAGSYSGATGNGTVAHRLAISLSGAAGTDTYEGTIDVAGHEFDLAPPVITAASRTVRVRRRAKRARVTFLARARDDVDGTVPVLCRPRSGSFFKLGRTVVTCSATDTSANAATARLTVTVKRKR